MADKVIVTKNKLDDLADSISTKAGVATPMTLSEMKTAVDNIQTGKDTLVEALHNRVKSVSDDTLIKMPSFGLAELTALTSVSFPNLLYIEQYGFSNDRNIDFGQDAWPFPKISVIGHYAFNRCHGLKGDIVLPQTVTTIGSAAFQDCYQIETIRSDGAIKTLGAYALTGSGHTMLLRECHFPNMGTGVALSYVWGSSTAANACQHLEVCDIGKAKSISSSTFANCYALQTLIMRGTSVTTLSNVSVFLNTPVRGYNNLTAKIYVPEALIDQYKAASNWKTIDGYGFVEWCAIEGSDYEL